METSSFFFISRSLLACNSTLAVLLSAVVSQKWHILRKFLLLSCGIKLTDSMKFSIFDSKHPSRTHNQLKLLTGKFFSSSLLCFIFSFKNLLQILFSLRMAINLHCSPFLTTIPSLWVSAQQKVYSLMGLSFTPLSAFARARAMGWWSII